MFFGYHTLTKYKTPSCIPGQNMVFYIYCIKSRRNCHECSRIRRNVFGGHFGADQEKLSKKNGFVRSIDVSEYLGYSKPSVSRAMGILRTGEYIVVDKDGAITLTDTGREIAEKIYERHTVLSGLLMRMGVSEEVATADACKLEHAISDESFQAIKRYAAELIQD